MDVKDNHQSLLLLLLLGLVVNHALSCQHQTSHTSGVHQSSPDDLGRINNAALLQVYVSSVGSIETSLRIVLLQKLSGNQVALETSILADSDSGDLNGILDDSDSCDFSLSQVGSLSQSFQALRGIKESRTSSGDDAFSQSGLGSAKCVSHSVFNFSDFHLTGTSDLDHSNTSLKLGQSLLEFFLIIAAISDLDLLLDDFDSVIDVSPI